MSESDTLPTRPLADSGVWMRILGDRPKDPRTPAVLAFYRSMRAADRSILLPAPSLAELLFGQPLRGTPSVEGLEHVPFGRRAAEILGIEFPPAFFKVKSKGLERDLLKYDAMIAACAKASAADCIVTLNEQDFLEIGKKLGLRVANPREFEPGLLNIIEESKAQQALEEEQAQVFKLRRQDEGT